MLYQAIGSWVVVIFHLLFIGMFVGTLPVFMPNCTFAKIRQKSIPEQCILLVPMISAGILLFGLVCIFFFLVTRALQFTYLLMI